MINLTKTSPCLGDNAFDEGQEIFLSIDADAQKKQLSKDGVEHGKKNFPDSQASQPGEVEFEVIRGIMAKKSWFFIVDRDVHTSANTSCDETARARDVADTCV